MSAFDFWSHFRNYFSFCSKNGVISTVRGLIVEIYFWSVIAIRGFGTAKPLSINNFSVHTIPGDYGISAELRVFGNHEPLSAAIITKMIKKSMTCIDIGSNLGFYALIEGKAIGKDGKLIVVEPSPKTIPYLRKNLEANHLSYCMKNIAISDVNGECFFEIKKRSNLSQIQSVNTASLNTIKVPTLTLDSLVSCLSLAKVDFLRMDVEGSELLISKGWQKTIQNFKPLIFIEIHKEIGKQAILDILVYLEKSGYRNAIYIRRCFNNCLIGNQKHIKFINLNKFIRNLKNLEEIPYGFHIITDPNLETETLSNLLNELN